MPCNAIHLHLRCLVSFLSGPSYTEPNYLVMAGPQEAFPNLSDPVKLLQIDQALHKAFNLDATYPATNIKIWIASSKSTPATPGRHLLAANTRVVVLGYTLAKVQGLPKPAVLDALVKDSATTQKVAQGLAEAKLFSEEFFSDLVFVLLTS